MSLLSVRMNIARVNFGFFTGFKKIKQRRISFVLGYLRMIQCAKLALGLLTMSMSNFHNFVYNVQ